jgi:hypothetical protein
MVLSNLRPLVSTKAHEVYSQTLVFHPYKGFLPGLYQQADRIETEQEDVQRVGDWLRRHITNLEEYVIVSWEPEDAVATTAAIFCDYWDDFCYPASDDISVTPLSEDWMLVYRHDEVLFFRQHRANEVENRP